MTEASDLWVFAYGSLMWDPGFPFVARERATLAGYTRDFCVRSRRHRGTTARPGLVLGLAPGGHCVGLAYRVHAAETAAVRAYLFEREMRRYEIYRESVLPVTLEDGTIVPAQTYVADPHHADFAGRWSAEAKAAIIAAARGGRGSNRDYLERTMGQLESLGIAEPGLEELARLVRAAG